MARPIPACVVTHSAHICTGSSFISPHTSSAIMPHTVKPVNTSDRPCWQHYSVDRVFSICGIATTASSATLGSTPLPVHWSHSAYCGSKFQSKGSNGLHEILMTVIGFPLVQYRTIYQHGSQISCTDVIISFLCSLSLSAKSQPPTSMLLPSI